MSHLPHGNHNNKMAKRKYKSELKPKIIENRLNKLAESRKLLLKSLTKTTRLLTK